MVNRITCLGVSGSDGIYIISRGSDVADKCFRIDKSVDGLKFETVAESDLMLDLSDPNPILQDLKLTKHDDTWVLVCRVIREGISTLNIYESADLQSWKKLSESETIHESGVLLSGSKQLDKYHMYVGGKSIKYCNSADLRKWSNLSIVLEIPQDDMRHHAIVASADVIDEGILVTYFLSTNPNQIASYSTMAMLFDKDEPSVKIWNEPKTIMYSQGNMLPIGIVYHEGELISYWQNWSGDLKVLNHGKLSDIIYDKPPVEHPKLLRHNENPLLEPVPGHVWQSLAVFNPAVVKDDDDDIHMLYRAVGDTNASVWGYAKSGDGFNFERHDKPVYTPNFDFEGVYPNPNKSTNYISGPGWGGCEDPRAVIIDDRMYVTYVAFSGYSPARVAMTSIDTTDLKNSNWKWSEPIILSKRHHRPQKNWTLFPEKINGKFAILHSIFPEILIDYLDTLEDTSIRIESDRLDGHILSLDRWDTRIRGVGPPPIKTYAGWLLLYHAMDIYDPGKYKLGVMLLDHHEPKKILYRSLSPILEPSTHYENGGLKPGVIFATGSAVVDGSLNIYYGAGDSTVSLASYDLDEFLYNLINHAPVKPHQLNFGNFHDD